jgi:hypothetical protein
MANEPSEDKGWDPNDDPDFDRGDHFGGGNAFDDHRPSNPIFDNHSLSHDPKPIS